MLVWQYLWQMCQYLCDNVLCDRVTMFVWQCVVWQCGNVLCYNVLCDNVLCYNVLCDSVTMCCVTQCDWLWQSGGGGNLAGGSYRLPAPLSVLCPLLSSTAEMLSGGPATGPPPPHPAWREVTWAQPRPSPRPRTPHRQRQPGSGLTLSGSLASTAAARLVHSATSCQLRSS